MSHYITQEDIDELKAQKTLLKTVLFGASGRQNGQHRSKFMFAVVDLSNNTHYYTVEKDGDVYAILNDFDEAVEAYNEVN